MNNLSAFDNIQGYSTIINKLKSICSFIKNDEKAYAIGATRSYSIMFAGMDSYEKENLINAFISECNIKTKTIDADPDITFTEALLNEISSVKEAVPAILYFKNVDKLACETDCSYIEEAIKSISDKQVYIIATESEMNCSIDYAFNTVLEVNFPTPMESVMIAKHELQNYRLGDSIDIEKISRIFNGYGSASIRATLKEAAILAASKGQSTIEEEDLYYAIYGVNAESIEQYTNDIGQPGITMAVYETGKAIVTEWLFPDSVQGISIVDTSIPPKYKGILLSDYYDDEANGINGQRRQLMIAMAGRIACELALEESFATKLDLNECHTISKAIIDECGAGDITLATGYSWDYDASPERKHKNEQAQEREIRRCYDRVEHYLQDNIEFINIVGGELIEKGVLTYDDFKKLQLEYWSKSIMPETLYDIEKDGDVESLRAFIVAGQLHLEGQDLGSSVESIFGEDEYEYFHVFSQADTKKLMDFFNTGDLIPALKGFFHGERKTSDFYSLCEKNQIIYETKII